MRILAVYTYGDNLNFERYCYIPENVIRVSLNNVEVRITLELIIIYYFLRVSKKMFTNEQE